MHSRLFKNLGLKFLAVTIAVALWVLVAGEEDSVRVFTVPIDPMLSKDRARSSTTKAIVRRTSSWRIPGDGPGATGRVAGAGDGGASGR